MLLFHWLDGIKHFSPDRFKLLDAPKLKSFYERAVLCPGIAKRLRERTEKFTNKAPGSVRNALTTRDTSLSAPSATHTPTIGLVLLKDLSSWQQSGCGWHKGCLMYSALSELFVK